MCENAGKIDCQISKGIQLLGEPPKRSSAHEPLWVLQPQTPVVLLIDNF